MGKHPRSLVTALLLSVAGVSSARDMDCGTIDARVAFVFEHELCALQAGVKEADLAGHFARKVTPRTYRVEWGAIPEAERVRLKAILGGGSPADRDEVGLVEKSTPDWLTKTGKPLHSGDHMIGGGGLVGGALRLCMVGGQDGHFEVAKTEALRLGWSKGAATFLASASRDADTYEWNVAAAHAQTPNDPVTKLDPAPAGAIPAFREKIAEYVGTIRKACGENKPDRALYVLGYLIHAVQDLSTHAGQTNAEHSYRILIGDNPDANPKRVKRSRSWTSQVLSKFSRDECGGKMQKVPANAKVEGSELFDAKDGTFAALAEFEELGVRYWLAARAKKVTPDTFWFPPDREPDKAERFFQTEVLDPIEVALRQASQVAAGP